MLHTAHDPQNEASVKPTQEIENSAGTCPRCECDDLEYSDSGIEGLEYFYKWTCHKCSSSGKEWHDLVFSEHIIDD